MATNTRNETTTSNATTTEFSYTFDVIKKEDVKVALDGVTQTSGYSVTTTPAKVTFDSAVGNNVKVRVYRDTEVDTPSDLRHTFQAGSAIRATDLNKMYEHALFGLQEEQEDGRILAEDINDDAVTRSKIIADAVDGTKIADDAIDSEHYTDLSIDTAHIANDAVTVAKIADTQLKDLANNLSSTATELNQLDGKTVTGTFNGSNTNDIPTSSAINSFVVSQLDAVGAFIAIENEVSFPNTHPDPEDNAGTVVSIGDCGGVVVNSSGVSTTGRTLGGSTVTITGFPSSLQSKTFEDGMGLLVQTTTTLNTYTYHKAIAKDADLIALSDSINSFNNRYRFGSDDPTDSLDDGDLFFNTSQDTFKVYNATDSAWQKTTPTAAELSNMAICAGNTTYTNDLGLITDAVATSSEGSIDTVAGKITEIGRLGTADAVADLAILATTDVVADMNTLATSDIVSDLDAVADKVTEIGRLGTADAVADLALLGTTAAIADMALLGDSAVIADMALLGDSAVIADMATIADTSNLTTNIGTVAGIASDVTAVAGDATDIGAVAGKATEIGRLGTADAVADMNTLGTNAIVSDMDTLADISSNITTVAGISANVTTVAGNNSNVTSVAGNATNINTVAGSITNVNNTGGSISNVNTVAGAIADVNRYANEYKIASSAPGSASEGDLWYDSTNNILKYYTGSAWTGISDAGINDIVEDTSPQLGGNLDGQNNSLTSINDIAAVSLDISGNVDVDGTLETDALTIDGATLAETIADTVGAMVGSNTETGITVTYQDADNTLDFAVGTLNQSTTGNAATATALETARNIGGVSFDGTANINLPGVNTSGNQDTSGTASIATTVTVADESSDTTCFPMFATAATGNLGPKSGSNLTFNSSTGDLTATLLNGGAGANLDLDFGSVA